MPPAASRLAALAAFTLLNLPSEAVAAGAAARTTPTRPGESATLAPLAVTRVEGVDYFNLDDAVARLGLKSKGRDGRKLVFADANSRLVIDEGREIFVDGSRLFLGSSVILRRGQLYVSKIDFERCLTPLLAPWLVSGTPAPPKIIAIDPGHGGVDHGMENPRLRMKEKTFTLDVALRLKKILETSGCKVVLTRKDDRALAPDRPTDWKRRAEVANHANADLLVSIHFNALENDAKTGGSEVYTFTPQFQRSTRSWSPGQANDTEAIPVPVNRFDAWSAMLGHKIKGALLTELKTFDRGQKTMHSGVLRGLNCPGVLVESVFLSNDTEARLVATPAYRQRIAQAIADGILNYAETLNSLRPKPAAATATPKPTSSSR
jgi:N-acetylmuramoyl-L-alanine amidase